MGITLSTGTRSSAPPSLKLHNVGDSVKFAVVDVALDLPMTEYGTEGQPKLNSRGKQMTQHAVTVLVLDAKDAVVPDEGGQIRAGKFTYSPADTDELATIYVSSWAKWDPDGDAETAPYRSWGAATDEVGAAFGVGTIGEYKFVREVEGSGAQPRRDRRFRFRAATAEEAHVVKRCEELYHEMQTSKPSSGIPLAANAAAYAAEEPF